MEPEPSHRTSLWVIKLLKQLEDAQTVEEVQTILNSLDTAILSDISPENVLKQLQGAPQSDRVVALVLSFGTWVKPLSTWLTKAFPESPEGFSDTVHGKILARLPLFLNFLHTPHVDTPSRAALIRAELFVEVIPALLRLQDGNAVPDEVAHDGILPIMRKIKQSQVKQARRAIACADALDIERFEGLLKKLKINRPTSKAGALLAAHELLKELRDDMEFCLKALGEEDVMRAIQRLCVTRRVEDSPRRPVEVESAPEGTEDEIAKQEEKSLQFVQPMKVSLYFESAKDLGEWKILVSSRADRDLRRARKSGGKFFNIVMKKIVELSNGHFSNDNQKQLNKGHLAFPVFEAKMTGDTRLVYHIDCVSEFGSNVDRQVIKLFGIYTHAQFDNRLWSSVGYHLSAKGSDYRRRCTFRNRPSVTGDNVILPAMFPPAEKDVVQEAVPPKIPSNDLEEVHSLLVLEKYVTLSRELYASIWADLDVAHVFNVSAKEKEIIDHPHSCYVLGRSGTGKTTTMTFKMLGIERGYTQETEGATTMVVKPRQLFVTQSRVLANRVEGYFSKLIASLAVAPKTKNELKAIAQRRKKEQTGLFNPEDDETWNIGLPDRFRDLQDEHFPLFLTYTRLAEMLEADFEIQGAQGRLIDFKLFLSQYWPHFSQDLTKNLDPALVFNEIIGVIEGSEQALETGYLYMDRLSYESLSHRAQPVFANQRDRLYTIFKAYNQFKHQRGDYDAADRTHRILKGLESNAANRQQNDYLSSMKVDFIYVDEAQDNLLIDAMVLRALCRNPNGLFWAGDSAQTIATGSSFRFNDLKAFLYRLEQRRQEDEGTSQSELRTFHLAVNYRSHAGILRCATTVIELITRFWPYSIDSLAPEQGMVDGAKPVFFECRETDSVRYEQFLLKDCGESIEFGARQCILVRDEAAKVEFRNRVGNIGIIMTLYESKGLEFDDVLLYKFFEDSTVEESQWRVVLNMMKETGDRDSVVPAPRFHEERHAGVCSELKFLYVAVTRSRKNLWIVDFSNKATPMKTLWDSQGLLKICQPGEKVPHLAVKSTPEEWKKTGFTLFKHERYLQSMHAYERAGLLREAKIAHTHYLRDVAMRIQLANKKDSLLRREALCAAASSFLQCAETSMPDERTPFIRNAGKLFKEAAECAGLPEDYRKAAEAYHAIEEYDVSALLYRKGGMFDEAVDLVRTQSIDGDLARGITDVARIFYFRNKELQKAEAMFDSLEDELEYLDGNILLEGQHADLLVKMGKIQEAADVHLQNGHLQLAIQALLADQGNVDSIQRANDLILRGLWRSTSFADRIKADNIPAREFLELASSIDADLLLSSQRLEISIFQNILAESPRQTPVALRHLAYAFLEPKAYHRHRALLCFDHYFLDFPELRSSSNHDVANVLADFLEYCRLFADMIPSLEVTDTETQLLFSFEPASSTDHAFKLVRDSWLCREAMEANVKILENQEDHVVLFSLDLRQVLLTSLRDRLQGCIQRQNNICHSIPAFSPCLQFVVNNSCRRPTCPQQHVHVSELTEDWLQAQIRIHLLQILIYQVFFALSFRGKGTIYERRYWIGRLFETLCPPTHLLGAQYSLHLPLIPEARSALETTKHWALDIHHTRGLSGLGVSERRMLSSMYQMAVFASGMLDNSWMRIELPREPLFDIFVEFDHFYRHPGSNMNRVYILPELYQSLNADNGSFILSGVGFLKQVVETKKIPIAVNVLCHFVDFLVGSSILAKNQFSLHHLTLPRGWLSVLLCRLRVTQADTRNGLLLSSLKLLLSDLIRGGESAAYLLVGPASDQDLSKLPFLRELFVHRVCRAIGLLGYNIDHPELRQEIVDAMKILDAAVVHHPTFRRFIRPKNWTDVAKAVEETTSGSPFDELICLCSKDKVQETCGDEHRHSSVRRIIFETRGDALRSLGLSDINEPNFVHERRTSSTRTVVKAIELEPEQGYTVDHLQATSDDLSHAKEIPEAQFAVARMITRIYLQALRNRNLQSRKTLAEKNCDAHFDTCLQASASMALPRQSLYRKLYLGILPHLLVCIDAVSSHVESMKARAQEKFLSNGGHETLEDLHARNTNLRTLVKRTSGLKKILSPHSPLHRDLDVEHFKDMVVQVKDLVHELRQSGARLDIQVHLALAVKGALEDSKVPIQTLRKKPVLNTDDIDDWRGKTDIWTEEDGMYDGGDGDTIASDASSFDAARRLERSVTLLSDEHLRAAVVLSAAYRRRLLNVRLDSAKTATQKASDAFFEVCWGSFAKPTSPFNGPHHRRLSLDLVPHVLAWFSGAVTKPTSPFNGPHHRRLYLGLVPHVLAWLDDVEWHARIHKSKAYKKLLVATDVDQAVSEVEKLGNVRLTAVKLRKKLDPHADTYKKGYEQQLREALVAVKELIAQVEDAVPFPVRVNFEVAINGL